MNKLHPWFYVAAAVGVALAANAISAKWASKPDWLNGWLALMILISPLAFVTFGLVTTKLGLAMSAGTVDSLLTISTIFVGLVFFREWNQLSGSQIAGILATLAGIVLMHR